MTASSESVARLLLLNGQDRREIAIDRSPFGIGRRSEKDMVISDGRVSRDHCQVVRENGAWVLHDQQSRHGTWVNGKRITAGCRLNSGDRIELGGPGGVLIVFDSGDAPENLLLSQMSVMESPRATGDLEKLRVFLELARQIFAPGGLDEVWTAMIEATLRLTGAERGFIFLADEAGALQLAAGRSARGESLADASTLSRSTMQDAMTSSSDFLFNDTSLVSMAWQRQSIMAHDLRMVLCIPLRPRRVGGGPAQPPMGVFYLDSTVASRDLSAISHDLLRAIATEAAGLVENARLARAEQEARRYQQELAIAASIQQQLMTVVIPDVPYAAIEGRNRPCLQIGGDFFDVVATPEGTAAVLTDVSGKGVSAAILASTLQGMIYSQLQAQVPLAAIAGAANRFVCQKCVGEKYATLVILLLHPDGRLEYINCGHIAPVVVSGGAALRLQEGNLPVGLIPMGSYTSSEVQLRPGDRVLLCSDGVTEAENGEGEFFGEERFEQAAARCSGIDALLAEVDQFRAEKALGDDCTLVQLTWKG